MTWVAPFLLALTLSSAAPVPPADSDADPRPADDAPVTEPAPRVDGPRGGRTFGVGLSGGYDGALAITLSLLASEHVAVEASIGLLFPTIDARVRVFGFREMFTPVVGLGLVSPLADEARFGLKLDTYRELYELGQLLHVDVGVSFAYGDYLDVFAGVAFVTSLNQNDPDRVLFFPQLAIQALAYF